MTRSKIGPIWLVLLTSLWLASIGNVALWLALWRLPEIAGFQGLAFLLGFFAFIAGLQTAFLSIFTWHWTLKPVVGFCLIATALGAYFMVAYGVVIDKSMMVNVLQTDIHESKELLSLRLLLALGLLAILPIGLMWRAEIKRASFISQLKSNLATLVIACLVAIAAVMLTFQSMASVMRNHKQIRFMINPLNSIYALGLIAREPFIQLKLPTVKIGEDAHRGASWATSTKPLLLILVVGETARAANFSLNGYERNTNPELSQENVVSFKQAYSCGTSTAASVPCMFSHLGRVDYGKRNANYENLLPVLKRAGMAVLWRDNNAGCKGVCSKDEGQDMQHLSVQGICTAQECLDEILLHQLDAKVDILLKGNKAKGAVIILHQMGSHGPAYYLRSPKAFKIFLPECETNTLQSCTREQVINAYDNTILYTDHFLAQTLQWLKARSDRFDTAMLYMSDHGESLGENNIYLHGLPYMIAPDVQTHIPMIVWLSPQMEQRTGVTMQCLREQQEKPFSHDNLFHSVLGVLDIQTAVYRRERDLFALCEKATK